MSRTKETLIQLKLELDEAVALKQAQDGPKLQEHFVGNILPHLIALRGLNRCDKNELEAKNQRNKDLYQNVISIQQESECLEFEASCLLSDVNSIRSGTDSDCTYKNGLDVDHDTRMQLLDVEEARRKELQKKLLEMSEETKEIETIYSRLADQLDQWKPYIKQLLDKVVPSKITESIPETETRS